jgi:hypothetical protein
MTNSTRPWRGKLVVHSGRLAAGELAKAEHVGLSAGSSWFVESYMPIFDPQSKKVVGVMELYKVPVQLNDAIRDALIRLWIACALSAAGLFVTLYWTVARADRVMREQQARLDEAQSLATAVELARAVAHNLRNPLASIRVSAEMLQGDDLEARDYTEHCGDITASVDRADRWITELVRVSQAPQLQSEQVQPSPVIRDCLHEMQTEMTRRGITWSLPAEEAPAIQAHTAMLRQILVSILANAIDVLPQGGTIGRAVGGASHHAGAAHHRQRPRHAGRRAQGAVPPVLQHQERGAGHRPGAGQAHGRAMGRPDRPAAGAGARHLRRTPPATGNPSSLSAHCKPMASLLIIEDEEILAKNIARYFEKLGHTADVVHDGMPKASKPPSGCSPTWSSSTSSCPAWTAWR